MFKSETTSFQLLFPKDSESLKIVNIRLWEVEAKMNRQSDTQTDISVRYLQNEQTVGHTDTQTGISTYREL